MQLDKIRELLFKLFPAGYLQKIAKWESVNAKYPPDFDDLDFDGFPDFACPDGDDAYAIYFLYRALSKCSIETIELKLENYSSGWVWQKEVWPIQISEIDFIRYARKKMVSPWDFVALSLGLVPDDNYDGIMNALAMYKNLDASKYWIFSQFSQRIEVLFDHFNEAGQGAIVEIDKATELFVKLQFEFPSNLLHKIRLFNGGSSEPHLAVPLHKQTELSAKERSSLLTMVHAMGKNKPYLYDPNDSHNGAIKRIENAVIDAGLLLSDKTIRKYLREAISEAERLNDKNQ